MHDLWRAITEVFADYWWVYAAFLAALLLAIWRFPRFRRPVQAWLSKEIVMPRWAIILDAIWRAFLTVAAITVLVLWYQSATRDEEADRNARIQTCSAAFAATRVAWENDRETLALRAETNDRHAETLFSQLVGSAQSDGPLDARVVSDYEAAQARAESLTGEAKTAALKAKRMARLQIGLARFSAASVQEGNDFECPPIPADLMVSPIDPTDP